MCYATVLEDVLSFVRHLAALSSIHSPLSRPYCGGTCLRWLRPTCPPTSASSCELILPGAYGIPPISPSATCLQRTADLVDAAHTHCVYFMVLNADDRQDLSRLVLISHLAKEGTILVFNIRTQTTDIGNVPSVALL